MWMQSASNARTYWKFNNSENKHKMSSCKLAIVRSMTERMFSERTMPNESFKYCDKTEKLLVS